MKRWSRWSAGLVVALVACDGAPRPDPRDMDRRTTAGAIAVANLDHEIARQGDEPEVVELLIARSRFLSDYDALARAVAIAEAHVVTGGDYLRRARARAAVHRFREALLDVAAAERGGADGEEASAVRASILVAIGRARDVVPQLEADAAQRPGFSSRCALAAAYAMVGRLAAADDLYAAALADLHTTSPFPYAWVQFARGVMWEEQGADTARAAAFYARALVHLPGFTAASVHLAELEAARGEPSAALARVEPLARSSDEPQALALLGALHLRLGDVAGGRREIAAARQRFESLLARYPLAFADHAAEFYLGPGGNAERAWLLAKQNLSNRHTRRAVALAMRAASAAGRRGEACELAARLGDGAEAWCAGRRSGSVSRPPAPAEERGFRTTGLRERGRGAPSARGDVGKARVRPMRPSAPAA